MENLSGKKIAILVANGFEQVELTQPKKALEEAGAQAFIVSPEKGCVKGWKKTDWGDEFSIDVSLKDVVAEDYDALLLPGGVINPDKLRISQPAIDFVKAIFRANKPIAAICHGPWLLINAEVANGHKLTSWKSIKLDLENAGAKWVDEEAVVDRKLLTSRNPDDIPAFNKAMINLFSQ